jgi:hypothetical protein
LGCSFWRPASFAATITAIWAEDVPCHDLSGEHGGYQVIGHDTPSKTWTIIRTETVEGISLPKRIIVGCRTHKYADGETLQGRDFCSLEVGRLYAWKSCNNGDIEVVDENFETGPPTLTITEGHGGDIQPNYEVQLFDILRYEALLGRDVKSSQLAPNDQKSSQPALTGQPATCPSCSKTPRPSKQRKLTHKQKLRNHRVSP